MKQENFLNKIRRWIMSRFLSSTKALQEPLERENKRNIRKEYKIATIDQMDIEQLNQVIKDREYIIEDEVIFGEILKRIGASQELIRKTMNNDRVKHILSYHLRYGELVSRPNGEFIFEDKYTNSSIGDSFPRMERTAISSDGMSITIKNTEGYGYYSDCEDGRPVNQVHITENRWKGITLENVEIDKIENQVLNSKIAYDNHNIEMKKEKEIYHPDNKKKEKIAIQRIEDKLFGVKETWSLERKKGQTIFYGMVNEKRPDMLYSDYFVPREENFTSLIDFEKNYKEENYKKRIGELEDKNLKAARYLLSFIDIKER